MRLRASDVMEKDVIGISPDDPLLVVHRLFVEEEIHGAPVVADDGQVLGVVTSMDLLRGVAEEHDTARAEPDYSRDLLEFSGPDWSSMPEDFQDRLNECVASDVMTEGVVAVHPDASIPEVARTLRDNHTHRVFVVDKGRLAGLISTFDLVALLEKER